VFLAEVGDFPGTVVVGVLFPLFRMECYRRDCAVGDLGLIFLTYKIFTKKGNEQREGGLFTCITKLYNTARQLTVRK
jgi:hypothetical protein